MKVENEASPPNRPLNGPPAKINGGSTVNAASRWST